MVDALRDDRAAADPGAARHGDGRHQGRRAAAAEAVGRVREAHGRARAARSTRSPAARSTSARPSSWARSCSTSRSCRAASATRTARGRPTPSVLEDLAAQGHALPVKILEHRQLAKLKGTYTDALVRELDAKTGRVHTSYHDDRRGDRPARLDRSQPAEHPGAHRGGPQDPPGLHRREGPQAAVGRLLADRAAAAGARRRHRLAEGGLRARRRHPRHHRQRDVRRAGQGHGPAGAAARQGDQLRHHLRHLGLRPRQPARHRPAGGARVHRQVLPALSRHPRLHGDDQGRTRASTAT